MTASPQPPPWLCEGWSGKHPAPEGHVWAWRLAHAGWRAGGDGKACAFTVGPGHARCKRPAVATLDRGHGPLAPRRWGYCANHLYGRTFHDDAVWEPHPVVAESGD